MNKRLKNSSNTDKILRINPSDPDPAAIGRAVGVLRRNGVLVFPTTGLYGLGADAHGVAAVGRVFTIKQRPVHMPLLVILSHIGDMDKLVRQVPDYARPLFGLWPGGITLIFEADDSVPVGLTGGSGKIGIRLPAHPVAKALTKAWGGPITGTSANRTGGPAVSSVADLDPHVQAQVDLILDAGDLAGGSGSTILDASIWPPKLIREGAVSQRAVDRAVRIG